MKAVSPCSPYFWVSSGQMDGAKANWTDRFIPKVRKEKKKKERVLLGTIWTTHIPMPKMWGIYQLFATIRWLSHYTFGPWKFWYLSNVFGFYFILRLLRKAEKYPPKLKCLRSTKWLPLVVYIPSLKIKALFTGGSRQAARENNFCHHHLW